MGARNKPSLRPEDFEKLLETRLVEPVRRASGELGLPLRPKSPLIRRRQPIVVLMREPVDIPSPVEIKRGAQA